MGETGMVATNERERIAAEVHETYLVTARRLDWPVKLSVNVPYDKLSEDAKELDRAFADWHLHALAWAREMVRQVETFLISPSGTPLCACKNIEAVKAKMETPCWYCTMRALLAQAPEGLRWVDC